MRNRNRISIPDRSWPGLTTTAIGAVGQQGADGNYATVRHDRRRRGGRRIQRRREERKVKSVEMRIGTLNVGTMTGKGRELADMMARRKVDILCVQETKWKGSKAKNIGGGYKLFYHGEDARRNGVGVIMNDEYARRVLEVRRVSDRVLSVKLEVEGMIINLISAYGPQAGCAVEEKEEFWSELDEVVESVPRGERIMIGSDLNGHVGEGNGGDEEAIGRYGVGRRNAEGQMVVDFAKRMRLAVVNTYFKKKDEHRVTYKSGGRDTQIDYILCRRDNLKDIGDCKVVAGESVVTQHRMVVCKMSLKKKRSERGMEAIKRIKWWKLKRKEWGMKFKEEVIRALDGKEDLPDDWKTSAEIMRGAGRKVLGLSSGQVMQDKETWWWGEEVQESIRQKTLAKKNWYRQRDMESRQRYKETCQKAKREVAKARAKAYDDLYGKLETKEGEKELYRLARQRDRAGKDVQHVRVIKDADGNVLTNEECVRRRWKGYFEELMNVENDRELRLEAAEINNQEVEEISMKEVRRAMKKMKKGKAVGPDDIPVEAWLCLGEIAVRFFKKLCNRILNGEKMPREWRESILVPIFKNKGDAQNCSNYRGIKLISHGMKIWERIVEARLRGLVRISEEQFGFMPGKSTVEVIFALR